MAYVLGTAGHIDHGKTTLVRALTGVDCDRLAEEKKRGITIELGFAQLEMPGGGSIGVVDVPGHEKFVKHMVSGAAGIDFVMLVVAADEGVMPQTREHLEICQLLDVRSGLVALSKIDAVEEDLRELAAEEVREYLADTFLAEAEVVGVSAKTGEGLEDLRAAIARASETASERPRSDLPRLPVDRVFSMRGFGTVITGTLTAGKIRTGQDAAIYPRGRQVKVRGLQRHGESAECVEMGNRCAVNLSGVETEEVRRGDVVAAPGSLFPSYSWDFRLRLLSSSPRSLRHRREVHFHHGSREVLARIHLLDRDELKPGEECLAQVRLPHPLPAVRGERVVLRSFSPLRTIGGGEVLNPLPRKPRRFSDELRHLERLESGDPAEMVTASLELAGEAGRTFAELMVATDLPRKELEKVLQSLGGKQAALLFDRDSRAYVAGSAAEALSSDMLEFMAGFHRNNPMKAGIGRGELASSWGKGKHPRLVHFLVERLLKREELALEGDLLKLPGHRVSLAADQDKLRSGIMAAYRRGDTAPPNQKDVLEELDITRTEAAPMFKLLVEQGELVKVKEDMFFAAEAMEKLRDMVRGWFRDHDDLGPGEMRELTGLSRKYAIPLLEHFDKERLTVRVGDKRLLREKAG